MEKNTMKRKKPVYVKHIYFNCVDENLKPFYRSPIRLVFMSEDNDGPYWHDDDRFRLPDAFTDEEDYLLVYPNQIGKVIRKGNNFAFSSVSKEEVRAWMDYVIAHKEEYLSVLKEMRQKIEEVYKGVIYTQGK